MVGDSIASIEKNAIYLTYALKFNEVMGLGLLDKTMIFPIEKTEVYDGHFTDLSFEKALQLINDELTVENLIEFTIALPEVEEYILQFKEIKDFELFRSFEIVNQRNLFMLNEITGIQYDIKLKKIHDAYIHLIVSFYKEKAVQLFVDAGFLVIN